MASIKAAPTSSSSELRTGSKVLTKHSFDLGGFDWEIAFGMPTTEDRLEILQLDASQMQTEGTLPLESVAAASEGWSAARLSSLWTEAALLAAADGRNAIVDEDVAQAFERVARRPVRETKGATDGK
jgi:transitional endoplasmic reticulum ATPase